MTKQRDAVFAHLDENVGSGTGDVFTDYDDRESVLQAAIESVEMVDSLTVGCGVGPLMSDIEAWVDEFEEGKR
jgi:hypothetical protein